MKVVIKKSTRPEKKLMAIFSSDSNRDKTVHFGANGMSDFTIHKDKNRKKLYLARHSVNENWNDPMTAGALSRWILWNKESFKDSVVDFKKRFKLG